MDNDNDTIAAHELAVNLTLGEAYVILVGGKEHNICIDTVGQAFVSGIVTINKVLLLIDRKGNSGSIVKVVLPQDEKNALEPGDELYHSEPIVTVSDGLKIAVRIREIQIIEDPWRPFIDSGIVSPHGEILNEEMLLEMLPALKGYYVEGRGFVRNPDVWAGAVPPKTELHVAEDVISSSESSQ